MSSKIRIHRHRAFGRQHGRCWYCGVLMWEASPLELSNVPPRAAAYLQCTAEHLQARSDGGRGVPGNLVAACRRCNCTRHKLKRPPSPKVYLAYVRQRISQGRWHPQWIRMKGLLP